MGSCTEISGPPLWPGRKHQPSWLGATVSLSTRLSIVAINVSSATVPNKANERGHCAQIFEVGVWPVTLDFGYNGLINWSSTSQDGVWRRFWSQSGEIRMVAVYSPDSSQQSMETRNESDGEAESKMEIYLG